MSKRYPRNVSNFETEQIIKFVAQTKAQSENIDRIVREYPYIPIPNKLAMLRYTKDGLNLAYQTNRPAKRYISDTRLGKKGT
jgi:hypothetical protein